MNPAVGRLIAKYAPAFRKGPNVIEPRNAVEVAVAADETPAGESYRAFLTEHEIELAKVSTFERTKLLRRLLDDLEREETRRLREIELIESRAAEDGLRPGAVMRMERLKAEADEIYEQASWLHSKLNKPAVNGDEPRQRFECSWCSEEISREEHFKFSGSCAACFNPTTTEVPNELDRIIESL